MIEPESLSQPLLSVKRLLTMYIAVEAVPRGGSYMDGVKFILDPKIRNEGIEAARKKMGEAIAAVKSMPGYQDKTDEEIAKILVDKINEKRRR